MTRFALLAGWALALVPIPAAAAPTPSPAPQAAVPDLRPDPRIRFGVLPNGMHYEIVRNTTPPHNASFRLRIGAGSLYEREDQRGLAHFIEHMAFLGTTHVPKGEFIKRLERAGLKFGPDTNATTSWDQTIYMLDLPETDAASVDTALLLLRETASEVSFAPEAIEPERGVVLSEERLRASPGFRGAVDELNYLYKGDLLTERLPIGLTEVLKTAPRQRFVDFYNAYYRPERATLVAVGDFDVDAMEAKIRSRFGDWQARGPAGAEPPPPRPAQRGLETHVFAEKGAGNRVALAYVGAPDLRPDSVAVERDKLLRLFALRMLNLRLERIAAGANPPFVSASAAHQQLADRAQVVELGATVQASKWREALAAIDAEQRRAVEGGFTQAELDRVLADTRTALTAAVAGASTQQSAGLAQRLVQAVNDREVFTSPADDLALFDRIAPTVTPAAVTETLKSLFSRSGPLLYMTSPEPVPDAETALRTAYETAHRAPLPAAAVQQAKAWPYTNFGPPGRVVGRRELPSIGATEVRFANGVRLIVKHTDFAKDQILVTVRIGNGLLDLPPERVPDLWAFHAGAFTSGGLSRISYEDLKQALTGKIAGASFAIGESGLALQGGTRPQDLATELQLLAAYASDPAFAPTGWNRTRALSGTIHDQLAATPGGILARDLQRLVHNGDPRWQTPSREAMIASSIEKARAVVEPSLRSGAIRIAMVGDVTVDEAIRQVAATFGALQPRPGTKARPEARHAAFPKAATVIEVHRGRADQGVAFVAWPTTDFYSDTKRARTLSLLSQVLQLRMTEEIRSKQGASYVPVASHSPSQTFPGYGYLYAEVEAPPEKLDALIADAVRMAADLRDRPVTEDELQRAKKPQIEGLIRQRAGNGWWLGQLADVETRPEALRSIETQMAEYQSITAADLQKAAREYLVADRAWKLVVLPQPRLQVAPAQPKP